MTDEQIKAECESRFQNGGPKLYVFDPSSCRLTGRLGSAAYELRMVDVNQQVWQRRMTRRDGLRRYEFVRVYAKGDNSLPKLATPYVDPRVHRVSELESVLQSVDSWMSQEGTRLGDYYSRRLHEQVKDALVGAK